MPTNTIPPCPSQRIVIRQGLRLEHEQRFGTDQFVASERAHDLSMRRREHIEKMRKDYDQPLPPEPPGGADPRDHADT